MTFRDFLGAMCLAPFCGAAFALALAGCSPSQLQAPDRILVGTGCGPEGVTMAATEEDAFPFDCDAIEPVAVIRAEG